jgi:hypothetical protein
VKIENPYQRMVDVTVQRLGMFRDGRLEAWELQPVHRNVTDQAIADDEALIARLRPCAEAVAHLYA